jgi:hypothetical protein
MSIENTKSILKKNRGQLSLTVLIYAFEGGLDGFRSAVLPELP